MTNIMTQSDQQARPNSDSAALEDFVDRFREVLKRYTSRDKSVSSLARSILRHDEQEGDEREGD